MSPLLRLVAVLASVCVALGATWTASDIKVTTLCGVSAVSPSEVFGAMADNALGPGLMHSTDSLKTSQYIGPAGSMNMDVAFTSNGKTGAMATVSGILLTQDAKNFVKVSTLRGVSQNVEAYGSSFLGATGAFMETTTKKQVNGIAVSSDSGANWNVFDIGLNSTDYAARYGAFPAEKTWYVSSGSWPYDGAKVEEGVHKLSARVHLKAQGAEIKAHKVGSVTGYPGAISKTTDGGATWTKVFDTESNGYFNQIHCYDTETCVAVAENEGTSPFPRFHLFCFNLSNFLWPHICFLYIQRVLLPCPPATVAPPGRTC